MVDLEDWPVLQRGEKERNRKSKREREKKGEKEGASAPFRNFVREAETEETVDLKLPSLSEHLVRSICLKK